MDARTDPYPSTAAASSGGGLLIDATAPALDPATRLLGLSLLRRLVLAARRAGFQAVQVVAPDAGEAARLARLVAGIPEVQVSSDTGQLASAATVVPADLLGEVGWLTALRTGSGDAADALRLTDATSLAAARVRLLKGLAKATDGFMSKHFARPISIAVSRRIVDWGVTPNQMTFVCMLIGLAAAPFFLADPGRLQVIGGLLFVAHSVLDGCDGELARLTFRESRFGGLFDFASDNAVHVVIFGCMGWGWYVAGGGLWPIALGISAVLGAGGSALAVYWLTLRRKPGGAGPVYTSVAGPQRRSERLTRMLDNLSRRDFIYLVFVLSIFGKADWFLAVAGIGAPVFLLLVLVVAWRERLAAGRG